MGDGKENLNEINRIIVTVKPFEMLVFFFFGVNSSIWKRDTQREGERARAWHEQLEENHR